MTRKPSLGALRHLALLACGALMIATVSLAGPTASASESVRQQIVFSRQLDGGGSNVFAFGPTGLHEHQVVIPFKGEDWGRAVVSHDGRHLLYSNIPYTDPATGHFVGFRPATSALDGSHFHLLVLPHRGIDMFCSAWTPDDRRIVCNDDSPFLFTMRPSDGGGRLPLTRNPFGGSDVAVGFSPDGSHLAFERSRADEQLALMVANADGSQARRITPFGLLMNQVFQGANWSPDGKSLISTQTDGHLIVISVDGAQARIISLQIGSRDYFAFHPDFSPDGRHIVFSAYTNPTSPQDDLYRADLDGSHGVQLTNTPTAEVSPDWAIVHA